MGFAKLPTDIELPKELPPGLTVDMEVQVLLPEKEGTFKAMWAVTSASVPDFGEAVDHQQIARRSSKTHGKTVEEKRCFAGARGGGGTQKVVKPALWSPVPRERLPLHGLDAGGGRGLKLLHGEFHQRGGHLGP